ncbi:butyrophilin subfamily 1 member A1-like isoform X4 [Clarias gariepinus]|uniref:butyrophilin subfamily 1 member A1-like isoform X4 n=1 Tax=Clarias gariepinus TaxID=13013 RepID=UPI00234C4FD9|nr:butyrophilin subfamily 1 member A1-like isoform X4 [Clarias gariepinus]
MFLSVIVLILYSFTESKSEQLTVFGPEVPLYAVAGEDLVLPCFIKPNTSAVDMTVEWFKLEAGVSTVHLYKDHQDRNEKQAKSYIGRTSLFKEELQKGNASLKLSAIRISDEGEYTCLIEDKSWSDDIAVHIFVKAHGSHPVITMESYDNSGGINLECESRGWNPAPDVQWLDREGAPLPAEETQIHRDTEGFNLKRRITVQDYSDSNKFYCRFQQIDHMMDTEVIINKQQRQKLEAEFEKMERFAELQRQRVEDEFVKKKKFAVDVTLDPDTAHPALNLSADGKELTCEDEGQNLPDTPQRFDVCVSVLGKQSFSSGRFYYEVQVSGKTAWLLGVVRENINRKGWIAWSPQNGFWTVWLRNENKYEALADPSVPLTLRKKVEKVGVFVDYEEGLVSFYDVNSRSHIYSFTGQTFTEKLYPLFDPWLNDGGKNAAPLIISPVCNTE